MTDRTSKDDEIFFARVPIRDIHAVPEGSRFLRNFVDLPENAFVVSQAWDERNRTVDIGYKLRPLSPYADGHYVVVSSHHLHVVSAQVTEWLNKGYVLHGPLVVTQTDAPQLEFRHTGTPKTYLIYAQAVTKPAVPREQLAAATNGDKAT